MDGITISGANRFIENAGISNSNSTSATNVGEKDQTSFADTLKKAVGDVNELQKESDVKMQELAVGKTDDVAAVMIAAEKADIALRTMVQVRNKIIDAYQEIMKMQV